MVLFAKSGAVQPAMQQNRPLRPTVFIGLGGTGLKTLARFRRRLYDRFGNADHWPIYAWLGIDTSKHELGGGGVVNQKGMPVPNLLATGMDAMQIGFVLDNLKGKFRHIGAWMRQDVDYSKYTLNDGAAQSRAAGRFLFVYHIKEVREKLRECCAAVCSQQARDKATENGAILGNAPGEPLGVDAVIVGSLAGGTGAGSFLDCAYLLRAMKEQGIAPIEEIRGMFLLPDVFHKDIPAEHRQRIQANGYAALQELEYFNGLQPVDFSTLAWGEIGESLKVVRGQPFKVCYLFSRNNGMELENSDEMYDLLADALAFSCGGGALAGQIRQCWSNAQGNYDGHLDDLQEADPATGDFPGTSFMSPGTSSAILSSYRWSTRFSSLGIAGVTMKLPELRRLAAVRYLRRLISLEVGADEPEGKERRERAEEMANKFLARQQFLENLPNAVADRIAKAAQLKNHELATGFARGMLQHLSSLAEAVDSSADDLTVDTKKLDAQNPDAAKLIIAAREHAQKTVEASFVALTAQGNFQGAIAHMGRVSDSLRRRMPKPPPNSAPFKLECTALDQWQDLDAHEVSDLFGLHFRAMRIIREGYKTWLTQSAEQYKVRINAGLLRHYLVETIRQLDSTVREVKKAIEELGIWGRELGEMQKGLAKQFQEKRNTVITLDLAATGEPDDQAKERALDLQMDDAIDRLMAPHRDENHRLLSSRQRVLEELWRRYQLTSKPATLLDTKREAERKIENLLDRLVDAAALLMTDLPEKRDLFEALEAREGKDVTTGLVAAAMGRARAYWHLNGKSPAYKDTLTHTRLSGARISANPSVKQTAIVQYLNSQPDKWQFFAFGPNDGTPEGELALVDEAHGYALQSLVEIQEMKTSYDAMAKNGQAAERHLDYRLISRLPDLMEVGQQQAIEQKNSWNVALLGIVLGKFRWNAQRGAYLYNPAGANPLEVGDSYEAVARWLRLSEAAEHEARLLQELEAWFKDRIELPDAAEASVKPHDTGADAPPRLDPVRVAQNEAARLVILDLTLDLLGQKVFTPKPLGNGLQELPPPHTTMVRLRRSYVEKYLNILLGDWPALNKDRIYKEIAPVLHKFLQFVGPGAPEQPGQVAAKPGKAERILQMVPRSPDDGNQVLLEAFRLGWYPNAQVPQDVLKVGLFPDYGKHKAAAVVPDVGDLAGLSSGNADGDGRRSAPSEPVELDPR